MTFDSEYELAKIAEHAPGARVLVRIKVPNVGSIVELSLKFGVDPADATSFMIKAYKLGLHRPASASMWAANARAWRTTSRRWKWRRSSPATPG